MLTMNKVQRLALRVRGKKTLLRISCPYLKYGTVCCSRNKGIRHYRGPGHYQSFRLTYCKDHSIPHYGAMWVGVVVDLWCSMKVGTNTMPYELFADTELCLRYVFTKKRELQIDLRVQISQKALKMSNSEAVIPWSTFGKKPTWCICLWHWS